VEKLKLGDRVGIGARASGCLEDRRGECSHRTERYCKKMMGTYNARYPDGSWIMGGYGDYVQS
jgi:alcohol dehydrogenase (NADP+)